MKEGKKRKRRLVLYILVSIFCFTVGCSQIDNRIGISKNSVIITEEDTMSIVFVGTKDDADCTIMQIKEEGKLKNIMIDTGEEQDAKHIIEILEQYQIEELDLLIITHPDKDHIGGLEAIVQSLEVKEAVIPYYEKAEEKYVRLLKRVAPIQNKVTVLTENETRQYGGLNISLYAAHETYYKKDNNYSIGALVQYGEVKMFFAGDAMKVRTRELLEEELPEVDLYKMAYHGRKYKDFDKLYWKLNPNYTVITAQEVEEEVLDVLEEGGTQIFYTREQDIFFQTDGTNLNIL